MSAPLSPHRRWNPLKGEWVLVSPHRMSRPWQGEISAPQLDSRPAYDPKCYLCPGNTRANNENNPSYADVFSFDNDFGALIPNVNENIDSSNVGDTPEFISSRNERGLCRVLCFSPRHDLTLAQLPLKLIERVVDLWHQETERCKEFRWLKHVMIFENKGSMMGCSNPHPHGQIWATEHIPTIPERALSAQVAYAASHSRTLLGDYLSWELAKNERIVCENESWVALVPYWAQWPYEAIIIPRRPVSSISELDLAERGAWAQIISELTVRYDNLFKCPFPYSMGIYQAPINTQVATGVVLHQIFMPPLLRSASIKKFMVGYELCAEAQRDITPEAASAKLREVSGSVHYSR